MRAEQVTRTSQVGPGKLVFLNGLRFTSAGPVDLCEETETAELQQLLKKEEEDLRLYQPCGFNPHPRNSGLNFNR